MAACNLNQLMDALWPPGTESSLSLWAIFDGARDPCVFYSLRDSGYDSLCLYSGRLPRELQLAAPYLVELPRLGSGTRHLLDLAWGHSWGIFLSIEDSSNLRHHLRKFLRVRTEAGRNLLFRYYDPRVLRAYLPTCEPGELKAIFGPIARFMVEDKNPGTAIEFVFDGTRLRERRVQMGDGAGTVLPAVGVAP